MGANASNPPLHPNVADALFLNRELRNRIAEMQERADRIFARRPSPSGLAIPEVDIHGRLTDLYLAPGTCARLDSKALASDILAAILESADDARRQYYLVMNDSPPRPLADVLRERRELRDSR